MVEAALSGAALLGGGIMDFFSQQSTNATNVAIANKQMEFQRAMSNTAMERHMRDLRRAGLNPMLAMGSPGATTPGGSSSQMIAPKIGDSLSSAVTSALEARRLKKEIDSVDSQVKLNEMTAAAKAAETKLTETNARTAKVNAEAAEAELPAIKQQSHADLTKARFNTKAAEADSWIERLGNAGGVIGKALGGIRRGFNRGGDDADVREYKRLRRAGARGVPAR